MRKLVLTFDVGTQSTRGLLVDKEGNIVDFEQIKYERPYYSKNPGWAEQEPDFYYEVICKIGKRLKEKCGELFADVIAVTMTTVRDTVLCLDKENKPLRDIILWLDKREADNPPPMRAFKKAAFSLAGVSDTINMQHRQSVCNWIMENEPELWKNTAKYVMLPTYLNFKLTGELKDSATNQIGHMPFDYQNRCWMKTGGLTRCLFDVPEEKLCELVDSGDTIGYITKECAENSGIPEGLPLIATGSDKACETLGLSVITKNKASVSFGTTATIQLATPDYFEPLPFAPSYPAVPNHLYNPEVQIYRGYWMLSWFKREFAAKECEEAERLGVSAESLLNKHLKEIPAGSDGLVLQPYWSPGVVTPNARGAIIGFSDVHTRAHLYRAVIEGIGFGLMDGLKSMEKRGKMKIDEIYVGGGGSQSDEICQITADMFGLPVKRIQTHEACGLGSSMVAFIAKGVYRSYEEAIEHMVRVKDTFIPDKKDHEIYKKMYTEIYSEVYNKLLPLYKRIKKINRREEK